MASIFGISDDSFKSTAGRTFSDVVEELGNKTIAALRKSLRDNVTLTTSKKLEQSLIAMPVKFDGKTLTTEIQGESYWKFLNDGVQGVGGDKKIGGRWVNVAPSSPFKYKEGKKPSVRHFQDWAYLAGLSPFAVRETVYRAGLTPNHFVDEAITEDFVKELSDELTKILSRTIEVDIKREVE